MSESSIAKTKRKLSALILNHSWSYQYSFFYEEAENCKLLPKDGNKLKKLLRKSLTSAPLLICYRTIYKAEYGGWQAYITVFSPHKIPDINQISDNAFSASVALRYRKLTRGKLESTASAIRTQKPQDLNRFFGCPTRRYSVINNSKLKDFTFGEPEETGSP